MTSGIGRRLHSLQRQLAKQQAAAEREAFFEIGRVYAVAHHLGACKMLESLPEKLARALNYRRIDDLSEALAETFQRKSKDQSQRGNQAYRQLFEKFGLPTEGSESQVRKRLCKIITVLPKDMLREIKADAAEQARDELEQAKFDAWYDELEIAVSSGAMTCSEVVERLMPWIEGRSVFLLRRVLES
jgi:hypothetical protein